MPEELLYVFGYGSLMEPQSLHRSAPTVDMQACIPATAQGFQRVFDVAFPNDGSQADKAYYAPDGSRPARVLLGNIRARTEPGAAPSEARPASVNGICIPVSAADLEAIRRRERRYDETDITGLILPYSGWDTPPARVLAFLGSARYTRAEDVTRGLVSRAYLETIEAGVAYWEQRAPGFARDYRNSTTHPPAGAVVTLRRVDL